MIIITLSDKDDTCPFKIIMPAFLKYCLSIIRIAFKLYHWTEGSSVILLLFHILPLFANFIKLFTVSTGKSLLKYTHSGWTAHKKAEEAGVMEDSCS